MGFRYRKSFKAGPVRINVSKSGVGYSVGGKGYRVTKKANGGMRTTASIPGTGISYVKDYSTKSKSKASASTPTAAAANVSRSDTSQKKYCVHCYRMMDAEAMTCPACGKSQAAVPKSTKKAAWLVACLVLGFILSSATPFIAVVLFAAAIYLSVSLIKDKKNGQSAPVYQAPQSVAPVVAPPKIEKEATPINEQPAAAPAVSYKSENHRATGMEHYMDNIMALACENDGYNLSKKEIIECYSEGDRVWKYDFYPTNIELVPEPDNRYDPNAIKVVVDGKHVAYIKQGSCSRVLKAIKEGTIHRITCEMGGGPYKTYYEDEDGNYTIEQDSTNYFVHLTIHKVQQ